MGDSSVLVVTGATFVDINRLFRKMIKGQETLMARFEELDEDIAAMLAEVARTATRVEEAVARLLDDTADQAQIEEARADVQQAVDALKAIAPEPEPPAEEPPTEPVV